MPFTGAVLPQWTLSLGAVLKHKNPKYQAPWKTKKVCLTYSYIYDEGPLHCLLVFAQQQCVSTCVATSLRLLYQQCTCTVRLAVTTTWLLNKTIFVTEIAIKSMSTQRAAGSSKLDEHVRKPTWLYSCQIETAVERWPYEQQKLSGVLWTTYRHCPVEILHLQNDFLGSFTMNSCAFFKWISFKLLSQWVTIASWFPL